VGGRSLTRRIGVATVARSDWGLYLPVLKRIRDDPELEPVIIAAGTHLADGFGATASEIEADGFSIDHRVETVDEADDPAGVARSMARGTAGFAEVYARAGLDLLLVLGDRFEMHSAVVAAVPFRLPVAHIQGGELTQGAIDDQFRHSITKLAHLHFASTEVYGRRIVQMGEEPWRVLVSGAPAIDNLRERPVLSREELVERVGLALDGSTLLVTYHPVTLEFDRTAEQVEDLLAALETVEADVVVTYPNVDTSGRSIVEQIGAWAEGRERARLVTNLGSQAYLSLMRHAAAMVGNSSSGLIEAASFELPVVNIGTRQDGRLRPANVIDVGYRRSEIEAGLRRALSHEFRESLRGLQNPYGDGRAAERIVAKLKEVELGPSLIVKRFNDLI
jgi:UDP-N-acetylglucosamine 2-epimerase (non-hydrolysing)